MAMKTSMSGLSLASPSSSSMAASLPGVLVSRRRLGTTFFNGGVGALKAKGVQTSNIKRLKCHKHRGGALGGQMNLFDWLAWVIKSYANSVLSCLEDPEKKLEQAVLEMNDDLTKMRQATAQDNASSLKAQLNRRVWLTILYPILGEIFKRLEGHILLKKI